MCRAIASFSLRHRRHHLELWLYGLTADKTSNIYRLTKEQYDKLIVNSITSTHKKANINIKKQINKAGKNLMSDKEVIKKWKETKRAIALLQ